MIMSFGDDEAERIFNGVRSKKLPTAMQNIARRKLCMIAAATENVRIMDYHSETRISEIIRGKRCITADTAIRFSKFYGTNAEFWLNLQNLYDLEEENKNHAQEFAMIKTYT